MSLCRPLLVALLCALALPASAGAARRAAKAPSPLTSAMTVAKRYWGATPCGGSIKVLAQRPLAPGADPATDAWVTFQTPLGANDLNAPAGTYTSCAITFARWRWRTPASMRADWGIFCATMTHEVGHLLGHRHDSAPGSVMAPVFTGSSSVPALCRANRPRPARR